MKETKYVGRIFPGGNIKGIIILFNYLLKNNVKFQVYSDGKGGVAFRCKTNELDKLPQWEGEPFFPTAEGCTTGFSLYSLPRRLLRDTKLYDGV
jgi:hypothetical protein